MKVFNNTKFSLEEIANLLKLGHLKSNWRQREIGIYEHPNDPLRVISVGTDFDQSQKVICDDERSVWEEFVGSFNNVTN